MTLPEHSRSAACLTAAALLLVTPLYATAAFAADPDPTVTLSGTVWNDVNGNGQRDSDESGLSGITLSPGQDDTGGFLDRTDPTNSTMIQATTDADGHYSVTVPDTTDFLAESGVSGPAATIHYNLLLSLDEPYDWESTTGLERDADGYYKLYTTTDLSQPGAHEDHLDFGLRAADADQHPKNSNEIYGQPGTWLVTPDVHGDVIYPEYDTADDGTQTLAVRSHIDGYDALDLNNLVIWHTDKTKETLPSTYTPDSDYSFIGPEGSTDYRSLEAGMIPDGSPWIGFSTQSPTLDGLDPNHPFDFRLDAVTGYDGGAAPGDVVLWQGGAPSTGRTEFSTKKAEPSAWSFAKGRHTHENWSFTEPGIYCMAFSVQTDMPDGSRQEAKGILTQIVGSEYDPNTIEPCGRHLSYPDVTKRAFTTSDTASPFVSEVGTAAFTARLDDNDDLKITYNQEADYGDTSDTAYSVDDVILHGQAGTNYPYRFNSGVRDGTDTIDRRLTWDTTQIENSDLKGNLNWTVDSVEGPGDLLVEANGEWSDQKFDTANGVTSQQIWAESRRDDLRWQVSRPGKYCVAMTWSGTTAEGKAISDHHTFTLVADGPLDPNDYFMREDGSHYSTGAMWLGSEHGAFDQTCAQGGQPTNADEVPVPDESGGNTPTDTWTVPNWSTTDSGATILNDGHIDIASLLADNTLDTQVKDTTSEGQINATHDGASWHDTDDVVLQLLPDSETSVPSEPQYSFLGSPGAPLWQVTESQQRRLLWPGWSTETIPEDATQDGITWTLNKFTGPEGGQFALYHTGTALGSINTLFNTRDGIDNADTDVIPKHSHVHGSWAFSAEGTYCLGFTRSATLADGTPVSDDFTLAVSVGRTDVKKIDPTSCFLDPDPRPSPDPSPNDGSQSGEVTPPSPSPDADGAADADVNPDGDADADASTPVDASSDGSDVRADGKSANEGSATELASTGADATISVLALGTAVLGLTAVGIRRRRTRTTAPH